MKKLFLIVREQKVQVGHGWNEKYPILGTHVTNGQEYYYPAFSNREDAEAILKEIDSTYEFKIVEITVV